MILPPFTTFVAMQKSHLISLLSTSLHKKDALHIAQQLLAEQFLLHDVIDVTFEKPIQVGFRASWVLECMATEQPQLLRDELEYFLRKLPQVTNRSARRHFSKLLLFQLDYAKRDRKFAEHFWRLDLEPILIACFDWLIDTQERVAVKVQCMDCIAALSQKYPWALEELVGTVEYLQHDATPAMQVRAKKLMRLIARTRNEDEAISS